MMGSTHTYDMTSGSGGGGGGQKAGGGGVDIALNPDELDLNDTEAMAGLVTNTLHYSVAPILPRISFCATLASSVNFFDKLERS